MVKINWNEVQEFNGLILKENTPIKIKFLSEGDLDKNYKIIDKRTNESKTVNNYTFEVENMNTKEKKEFSTISAILMNRLKEYQPLKNKVLIINKFRTGATDFDIDYKVQLIE